MRFGFKNFIAAILICAVVGFFKPSARNENVSPKAALKNLADRKIIFTEADSLPETTTAANTSGENSGDVNFLYSLCAAKNFQAALKFAQNAPGEFREDWLKLVFARWTQIDPQDALNALAEIQDETARSELFETIADVWSVKNPATLADYASSLPDSDSRDYALNKAIDNWSLQDPAAFAAWLNTSPPGVDLDEAIAEMISKADGANYPPATAMKWVESMDDPTLKWNAFTHVIAQWNQADSGSAQQYIATAPWLDDELRQQALEILEAPSQNIASDEMD